MAAGPRQQPPTPTEQALHRAFLAWVAQLLDEVGAEAFEQAVRAGVAATLVPALSRAVLRLDARDEALDAGRKAVAEASRHDTLGFNLSFNQHDPGFERAVWQHGAQAVAQVTDETRTAIQKVIADSRRNGLHPRQVAPVLRNTVGLTSRYATAVARYHQGQLAGGVPDDVAAKRAARYSGRLLQARATTIAQTETMRAATIGRVAGYEQAVRAGLIDRGRAKLEWLSVQDDPTEVCFQLNGRQVPLGSDFDGLMPPAHPRCRCVVFLAYD